MKWADPCRTHSTPLHPIETKKRRDSEMARNLRQWSRNDFHGSLALEMDYRISGADAPGWNNGCKGVRWRDGESRGGQNRAVGESK
jgi:hypothetical protein